jgi:hypothetical protein
LSRFPEFPATLSFFETIAEDCLAALEAAAVVAAAGAVVASVVVVLSAAALVAAALEPREMGRSRQRLDLVPHKSNSKYAAGYAVSLA